nr:transposase [Neobacillus massiliamazoniensis]
MRTTIVLERLNSEIRRRESIIRFFLIRTPLSAC